MKKISLVVQSVYKNNKVFDLNDKWLNQDNRLDHVSLLKKELKKEGYDLSTQDINNPKDSFLQLHSEVPKYKIQENNAFLMLMESPAVIKKNWDLEHHKQFRKIFTYNEDLINENQDSQKYEKIRWPVKIFVPEFVPITDRKRDFLLVSANKFSNYKSELYSNRKEIIDFFEKEPLFSFDLYGYGWENPPTSVERFNFLKRVNNRIFYEFKKITYVQPKSYKGFLTKKPEIFQNYQFCFVLENISDLNGYVTEKIWECFSMGVIPIYLGAPNINNYFPEDSFIDLKRFKSNYSSLIKYISDMSDDDKNRMLESGKEIASKYHHNFSLNNFVKPIINSIKKFDLDY
tara:strand:- start:9016 stop:10050 length:1035 start_codon:yes stop_codon:yes gene_type:complete